MDVEEGGEVTSEGFARTHIVCQREDRQSRRRPWVLRGDKSDVGKRIKRDSPE
jgi:hypothetical protein